MKEFEQRFGDLQLDFKKKKHKLEALISFFEGFWHSSQSYLSKLKKIKWGSKEKIPEKEMP